MPIVVEGHKIAEEIFKDLRSEIESLRKAGTVPNLAIILVGDNPASLSYIKVKQQKAREIGLKTRLTHLPEDVAREKVHSLIKDLNSDFTVHGIIVQLPFPYPFFIHESQILDSIAQDKDVDCLCSINKQRLARGEEILFIPPVAAAVMKIFEYHEIELRNKNILIVGSGELVGKPLASLLLKRGLSFKLANRFTPNLRELIQEANIIVSGVGKPNLITGEMVTGGTVVVDAGTAGSEAGELSGDVDFASVSSKALLITPVPGGVGPVTVATLFKNVVLAAKAQSLKEKNLT